MVQKLRGEGTKRVFTVSKGERCETGANAVFEKSMSENFLKLMEDIESQPPEGQHSNPKQDK